MDNEAQQALNAKLADAADNGSLSEVAALITAGADVNGKHCLDGCQHTPLIKAAIKGHIPVIMLLLEKGADTTLVAKENKTAVELALDNGKTDAITRIKAFEEDLKPDRVTFYSPIGDRTRQDVYDFAMKERITLIRQGRFGEVDAVSITGFSAIADQSDGSLLRKAFNEHVRRGGKTDESEIFSRSIIKARPGLQKPD